MNIHAVLARHFKIVPLSEETLSKVFRDLIQPLLTRPDDLSAVTLSNPNGAQIHIQQDTPNGIQWLSAEAVILISGSTAVMLCMRGDKKTPTIATINEQTIRLVAIGQKPECRKENLGVIDE